MPIVLAKIMQKDELCLLIRKLTDRQLCYAELIARALCYLRPDDPFMLAMYEVQDRMHVELRNWLLELPGPDPELMERFDILLLEHRLNLLLAMSDIRPDSG